MDAPLAIATAVKGLGALGAALAAGGALLLPSPRARALAALAALALAPVLLLGELWETSQIEALRDRPGAAGAALLAAVAAILALAAVLVRRPWLLPPLAVATLPFRLPVDTGGGESANLLIPLYVVVGAGVVAYAWTRLRGGPGERHWIVREPGRIEVALTAAVVVYAAQSLYSTDFEQALKNLAFFYVPFALLFKLLTAVRWSRDAIRWCFGILVGLALAFAAIGFWEYAARDLLWNSKVIQSNQFESYFRVNSLFFDPNIYGRFLAIVMVGLAAVLLWPRTRRDVWLAAGALAVLWAGLLLTFSQSSLAALLVGLTVLAGLRWRPRPVAYVAAAAGVAGVVALLALPLVSEVDDERSLDDATSGRFELVEGGRSMFLDRPLWGFGSGSFAERFRDREDASSRQAASASHTTPLTIGAEQGVLGLFVYGMVLAAAFRMLFAGLGGLRDRAPPLRLVLRAFVGAAFAALVFHTLLYAAFLEDPIAWTLLALGVVLRRRRPVSGECASGAGTRTATSSP